MIETKLEISEDQKIQAKLALILGSGAAVVLFGLLQSDPIARTEILNAEGISAAMLALALIYKFNGERADKQKSS